MDNKSLIRNEYFVHKVNSPADGFLKAAIWSEADELLNFSYPWEDESAPPMKFRALYDDQWLYCLFEVTDQNVKVYVNKNEKSEVIYGDRVEIFFRRDVSLDPYYCIETDPLGRVYDYSASHYRKFDAGWSWPSGNLKVQASQHGFGYSVYLMISLNSLNKLGLVKDGQMEVGLFRGKCLELDLVNEKMKWISWMKPDSKFPDFHIPSSFGVFRFL